MAKWEKLDDTSENIRKEPWSLYWSEMKSGSDEFEAFLHNPLNELVGLADVDRSWSVQTHIIGHDIGLLGQAVCQLAFVDPRRKTVFLTLYKH